MKTESSSKPSVRTRLLDAAEALFYAEGIHAVGIDRVLERAGVAKASLYTTFGSKDALVAAYLEARRQGRQQRLVAAMDQAPTARLRILSMFDVLARNVAEPDYRGCAFARVAVEAEPGGAVRGVCDTARAWLYGQFREQAQLAGAPNAVQLARQLHMIYDGAAVSASVDGYRDAGTEAREMVVLLLDCVLGPDREAG